MKSHAVNHLWIVLVAMIWMALSMPLLANDCSGACQAVVPANCTTGEWIPFHGTYTGDCYLDSNAWFFGDGTNSSGWDDAHRYSSEGTYHWTFQVITNEGTCTRQGDITIVDCPVDCQSLAVEVRYLGEQAYLEFGLPQIDRSTCDLCTELPPRPFPIVLDVYDGRDQLDGHWETGGDSIHSYFPKGPPPYRWTYKVDPPGGTDCTFQGTTDTRACKKVGSVEICGDFLDEDVQNGIYLFRRNVTINNVVFFTDPLTFTGNPDAGEGILTTAGSVQVRNGSVMDTLYSGAGLPLELNGQAGTLQPATADPNFQYGFTLGGVPLIAKGTPVEIGEDQVKVTPTFFVGIPPFFTLAEVKSTIVYPKGGWKELRGLSLVAAQVLQAPVVSVEGTYEPATGIFEFKGGIDFPFLPLPEASGAFSLWYNCFNGWELGGGGDLGCDLVGGSGEIASATLGMNHICEGSFAIYIKGTLALKDVAEDIIGFKDITMMYEHPLVFRLSKGQVIFMTIPVAEMRGTYSLKPGKTGISFQFTWNPGGMYQSGVCVIHSPKRKMLMITADGTLQVPNFDCGTFNIPCKVLRRAIKAVVPLPYEIEGVHMEGVITKSPAGDWEGHVRGRFALGPLGVAAQLEFSDGQWMRLIGTNYQDLWDVRSVECTTTSPLAQAKSVVVPEGRSVVLFAGVSEAAVPALTLTTPAGDEITPENVGSFPGVTYISDSEEGMAIFQVLAPAAGTWTLGQEGLPPEQVTLVALSPPPPPSLDFVSAQQAGDNVTLAATISPSTADSKISFLFAKNPEGLDADWIDVDVPAGAGQASATWDTSEVDSGTYYLLARTDDGLNPPVTAVYSEPIVVDRGTVQAPTGLGGTRTETGASLHWTASSTPGPLQYQVLWTDTPDKLGYPSFQSVVFPEEALIEELDPEKTYRFSVVAYDAEGNRSLESVPWLSYPPGSVPGDCDGDGTISIGEVQKAINMFLGLLPVDCGVDCTGDGTVSIGEVQKVINAFLGMPASC